MKRMLDRVWQLVLACVRARRQRVTAPVDADRLWQVVSECQRRAEAGEPAGPADVAPDEAHLWAPARELLQSLASCALAGDSADGAEVHEVPVVPGYDRLVYLARGGMGVVYHARHVALDRAVALKLMAPGAVSESRRRFLAEAEAVARVRHANVVQVFDSGGQADLYLAMEFCPGGTLAARLKCGRLAPRAAAGLMAQVAAGVAAAHAAGIVHRDLKPANVLFDADGVAKVADFGLAKRGGGGELTRDGQVVGTPAYMAPEQVRGDAAFVGPASDVWALGVMLYECLAGRRPFDAPGIDQLFVMVRREEPSSLRSLSREVTRDLESVCRKCLAKESGERYPDAKALAEDLQRYLAGEPVRAGRTSDVARAWKWAKRNRRLSGSLVATTAALVLGTAVSTWLAVRAQAAATKAEAAERKSRTAIESARISLDVMTSQAVGDGLARRPALTPELQTLLRTAADFYGLLATDEATDPDGTRLATDAAFRLGNIFHGLGQAREARSAYEQAVAGRGRLVHASPGDPKAADDLGAACHQLGRELHAAKDYDAAAARYRQAIALREGLPAGYPRAAESIAVSTSNLANVISATDPEAGVAMQRRAIAGLERLAAESPHRPSLAVCLAHALTRLGTQLRARRDYAGAAARHAEAVTILEGLTDRWPGDPDYAAELGDAYNSLANARRSLDLAADVTPLRRKSIEIFERLTAGWPGVPQYAASQALAQFNLGNGLTEPAGRVTAYRQAAALYGRLAKASPEAPDYAAGQGSACYNLGVELRGLGDGAGAKSQLEMAVAVRERLTQSLPAAPKYALGLASALVALGNVLGDLNDGEGSEAQYRRAVEVGEALVKSQPDAADYLATLGGACCNLGDRLRVGPRPEACLGPFDRAVEVLAKACRLDPRHPRAGSFLANSYSGRAAARRALKQYPAALADYEAAAALADPVGRAKLARDRDACAAEGTKAADRLPNR